MNSLRFAQKTAIVTGSSRGIGRAIATALARDGANVVVNGTNEANVESTVKEIRSFGGHAAPCVYAIGTQAAADALLDTAISQFGSLHILINNAAILSQEKLVDLSEAEFDRTLQTNLKSVFLNTQTAVKRVFIKQNYGKVLNFTSHAALRGTATYSAYAASKMGVVGVTMVWAHELARHHINVNCIAPAGWTDMLRSTPAERQGQLRGHFARNNVLQRVGEPEDVAPTALFLVSDEAQYLTGQVILVNGEPMYLM